MSESEPAKPTLSFYKNVRVDGGVRFGIDVDEERVFHQFDPGPDPEAEDPALEWYVSVDISGETIPTKPEAIREWLADHSAAIRGAINDLANQLRAGIDDEYYPLIRTFTGVIPGVEVTIRCSATRRLTALNIAEHLRDTAEKWAETFKSIPVDEGVPH